MDVPAKNSQHEFPVLPHEPHNPLSLKRLRHASGPVDSTASAAVLPREEALAQLRGNFDTLASLPQGLRSADAADLVRRLASDCLLRHPERDVRLWASKCLAEGLRVFAPEPPLDAASLKLVMEALIEQLAALSEAVGASVVHAVGLLERLVEIHAFALVFECDGVEGLLTDLVAACVVAVGAKEAHSLDGLLAQVLLGVLPEADDLPASALAPLVRALSTGGDQPATLMARRVIGGLAHRSAARFINDFLVDSLEVASKPTDDWEEEPTALLEGAALHTAVFELFAIDPALVARALPALHAELRDERLERRAAATRLVGRLLAHPGRPALLEAQPLMLDRFLERLGDAEEAVRLAALDGAAALLAAAAGLGQRRDGDGPTPEEGPDEARRRALVDAAARLGQCLAERSLDASMAVRLRAVEVAAEVAVASAAGAGLLLPVLPDILRRVLDKKPLVRDAAIDGLAAIYKERAMKAAAPEAETFAWAPRLLFEAFAVFAGGRLGHTAQLEEVLECDLFGAAPPAAALAAVCGAALGGERAAAGLRALLGRKAAANAALLRFVRLRVQKGSPLLSDDSAALALVPAGALPPRGADAQDVVDAILRAGPAAEEPMPGLQAAAAARLRQLDGVRDRSLWTLLRAALSGTRPGDEADAEPSILRPEELAPLLAELGRLFRVHRLVDLGPLLRRALLATWLLPDQAGALLEDATSAESARSAVVELSRHFPGAFLPHAPTLVERLPAEEDALRVLAILGKRLPSAAAVPGLADGVLAAVGAGADGVRFRRAARALGLLPPEAAAEGRRRLLELARAGGAGLGLAAAVFGVEAEAPGAAEASWLADARAVLRGPAGGEAEAAMELLAALGAQQDLEEFLATGALAAGAAAAVLRAMHRGRLHPSATLLVALGAAARREAEGGGDGVVSHALGRLQSGPRMRLVDRLRVCAALPCMWAFAPGRGAELRRMLEGTLAQALKQGTARKEPLLEVAVACFLHFLSRVDLFLAEAALEACAFPETSSVAAFFVEALVAVTANRGVELAQVAVRVADRAQYFVDREAGAAPDGLHRAACVLRHVAEKRCKELGAPPLVDAPSACCMPSELFAARPDLRLAAPALPLDDDPATQALAAPALPLEDDPAAEVKACLLPVAPATPSASALASSSSGAGPLPAPETFLRRRAPAEARSNVVGALQEDEGGVPAAPAAEVTPQKPVPVPRLFRSLGGPRPRAGRSSGGGAAPEGVPAQQHAQSEKYLTPKKRCSAKSLARLVAAASTSPAPPPKRKGPSASSAATPAKLRRRQGAQ